MKIDFEVKMAGIFLGILGLGFLGMIVLGKYKELVFWQWSIPVALMIIYLIFGLTMSKTQWNRQSFADSFYYMGFSFTLIALMISLNPFTEHASLNPETMLRYMGIALITTVIGLIGRTVMVQFRKTVSDQEEEAKEEIEQLTTKLQEQMTTSIEGFQIVSLEIDKTLNDSLKAVEETLKGFAKKEETLLEKLLEKFSTVYYQTIDDLREKLEAIQIPETIFTAKLEDALAEIPLLLVEFREILDASSKELKLSAGEVNTAIRDVGKNISVSKNRIKRVRESLEELYNVYDEGVSRWLEGLADTDFLEIDIRERMEPILEGLTNAFNVLRSNVHGTSTVFRQETVKLSGSFTEYREKITEAMDDMAVPVEIKETRVDIANYNKTLKELISNLERLNTGITNYAVSLRKLSEQIISLQTGFASKNEDAKRELEAYSTALRNDSAQVSQVVGKVEKVVTESIDFLNRKLS